MDRGHTLRTGLNLNGLALVFVPADTVIPRLERKQWMLHRRQVTFRYSVQDVCHKEVTLWVPVRIEEHVAQPGFGRNQPSVYLLGRRLICAMKFHSAYRASKAGSADPVARPCRLRWRAICSAFVGLPRRRTGAASGG
ncbi:hypothetical protein D3C72_1579220 [compost metagenome]